MVLPRAADVVNRRLPRFQADRSRSIVKGMEAILLSIGNELTCGQTVDTNAAWLSRRLAEAGVRVLLQVTAPDDLEPIRAELDRACARADVVLITGGLGPTEDDLTRQALAAAMGRPLVLSPFHAEQIRRFFSTRNLSMPEANVVQAMFPEGSTPIDNTAGTAPGIRATCGRATVFAMPGVPREMKVMFDRDVMPWIRARAGGAAILSRTLNCFGEGESAIGERIGDLMRRDRNPLVGTTASRGVIGIRVHARGESPAEAAGRLERTCAEIRARLGDLVFGEDQATLAHAVAALLIEQRLTVATAESCTGGLIAKSLTDVPGSSAYFIEGLICYANAAKTRLLGLAPELLAAHGAVSPQVAEAMAAGCRQRGGTDLAVSTTGIAGPTGGTETRPVGLVYIGLADGAGAVVTEHRLGSFLDREEIRDRAAKIALNRLRLWLLARRADRGGGSR